MLCASYLDRVTTETWTDKLFQLWQRRSRKIKLIFLFRCGFLEKATKKKTFTAFRSIKKNMWETVTCYNSIVLIGVKDCWPCKVGNCTFGISFQTAYISMHRNFCLEKQNRVSIDWLLCIRRIVISWLCITVLCRSFNSIKWT